ncbi:hypothetical protein [Massilia consociata]|uniref:Uncharacterized protein n=1 Tax=Massilia consociata TaxID=760117 RepID=A0ABV6FD61_9BURK
MPSATSTIKVQRDHKPGPVMSRADHIQHQARPSRRTLSRRSKATSQRRAGPALDAISCCVYHINEEQQA